MFKQTAQDRILSKFAAKHNTVSANIHDYVQVTPTLFKVIATFSTLNAPSDKLAQAIASVLGNEMSVVEGSFRAIQKAGVPAAVGFVRANRVSMDYDDAVVAKMKVMGKNILMSADDESLWEVRSSGDSKFLVRQAQDDLSGLVALAKVRAFNVPKLDAIATASASIGKEVVAYVDTQSEEVKLAAVIGTSQDEDGDEQLEVYAEDGEEVIDPDMVVESMFVADAIKEIAAEKGTDLPANLNSKDGQKQYWDTLFKYSPDYASMLRDMVDQHAAL